MVQKKGLDFEKYRKIDWNYKFCFLYQAISTIFTVEVQLDRWNNLISDLTASAQTTVAADIRKAAILTLGQICDKLKEFKLGNRLKNYKFTVKKTHSNY